MCSLLNSYDKFLIASLVKPHYLVILNSVTESFRYVVGTLKWE